MGTTKKRQTPPRNPSSKSGGKSGGGGKNRSEPPPKLEHVLSQDELNLHEAFNENGTTEGGACLCMHAGYPQRYTENTCSYRWQCHEKSKQRDRHIFNDRSDALIGVGKIETSAILKGGSETHPGKYWSKINAPSQKGDWHLNGPKRDDYVQHHNTRIPEGQNFTNWIWPYWHNAHHMIPKTLFWSYVSGSSDALRTMRTALMMAEYNIHHGINMIFSPMDEEIAAALNLPRHLDKLAMKDHPKYNAQVEKRLNEIIDGYKKLCRAKKKHPDPNPKLDKAKLEKLSKDCRDEIIRLGRRNPGAPLDKAGPIQKSN